MFCVNCGNNLADDACFCSACGTKVGEIGKVEKVIEAKTDEQIEDNQIKLSVKPTFNFCYQMLSDIIFCFFIGALIGVCACQLSIKIGIYTTLIIWIFSIITLIIKTILRKKTFENLEYCFYTTRAIFKDTFMNKSEKEVKYKHIREISISQSFYQRMFNLGNIYIHTNAETFANGLVLTNVSNVYDVYKRIKELTKI